MRFDSRAWGWASLNVGGVMTSQHFFSEGVSIYHNLSQRISYLDSSILYPQAAELMSFEKFSTLQWSLSSPLKLPFFTTWGPWNPFDGWRFHPLYSCDANSMLHKSGGRIHSAQSLPWQWTKKNRLLNVLNCTQFHHVSWSQSFHKIIPYMDGSCNWAITSPLHQFAFNIVSSFF